MKSFLFVLFLFPFAIFSQPNFQEQEQFLSDNPGYSEFFYFHKGKKYIIRIDPSVDSLWTPSEEQINQFRSVAHIGAVRVGIGTIVYETLVLTGNEESVQLPGLGNYISGKILTGYSKNDSWTAVGNRWIEANQGVFVDLDAGMVIHTAGRQIFSVHPIVRTW